MVALTGAMFRGVWASYDYFFKRLFGDGERTIDGHDGGNDSSEEERDGRIGGERQEWGVEGYGAVGKRERGVCRWV